MAALSRASSYAITTLWRRGSADEKRSIGTRLWDGLSSLSANKQRELLRKLACSSAPSRGAITQRWAKRGTHRSAPTDQRTASAYIFGAICPKHGKGAALIMPRSTRRPCTCTWPKSPLTSRRAHTRGASRRSGRLASVGPARHAAQHHLDPVAGEISRAQSAGKRLALPAPQLVASSGCPRPPAEDWESLSVDWPIKPGARASV